MRVALLQLSLQAGALKANFEKLISAASQDCKNADLFVAPEMTFLGYPLRDLLSYPSYLQEEAKLLDQFILKSKEFPDNAFVVGHSQVDGEQLFNCASLIANGEILGSHRKCHLPDYDIFDEYRFFTAGSHLQKSVFNWKGKKIGLNVCADIMDHAPHYGDNDKKYYFPKESPLNIQSEAEILINTSASPYVLGKYKARWNIVRDHARRLKKAIIYVNCVSVQDDIIFDGHSFAYNENGHKTLQAPSFKEGTFIVDTNDSSNAMTMQDSGTEINSPSKRSDWDDFHRGIIWGIREYFQKNGFSKAVLGLSGGVDSALCARLLAEALGQENIHGVMLSTAHNSPESLQLAAELATRLSIQYSEHSIDEECGHLKQKLKLETKSLSYQNLQARLRALILMSQANGENRLLVSTGNKSELAMGYSTLYGDLAGAVSPLGDLYKTEVYGLSHYLNCLDQKEKGNASIPFEILDRAPSAELADQQKDSDSLPSYEILDTVLYDLIENQALNSGDSRWTELLKKEAFSSYQQIFKTVHQQEFKRQQAPLIFKFHRRSFGSGWRIPISKSLPNMD